MAASPTLLPAARLHQAAAALAQASLDGLIDRRLAADLIAGGTADPELLTHPAATDEPALLTNTERLADQVASHRDAARFDPLAGAAALQRLAADLDPDLAAALDVLILRATDPFAALRSVPASALFSETEIVAIEALPRSEVMASRPGPTESGRYDGYAMAIMKITRLCNLRCRYCHDWREGRGNTMTAETMARTIHGFLNDPATGHLDVALHGGEPTMVGRRGLLRLLWLQARFLRPNQTIRTSFQTNGVGIDDDLLDLAARYGLRFGISLDLDRDRHDTNRPDVRGHRTFDRALDTARRAQRQSVLSGVIVVVDELLIMRGAKALYDELSQLGVSSVSLLAERPDNDPTSGDQLLSRRDWGRFLLDLDAERRASNRPQLAIRELDSLVEAVNGREATYCEHRGNCIGAFFVVEVDGTIGHCDRYVNVPAFSGFGVAGQGPSELQDNLKIRLLSRAEAAARKERSQCRWSNICRGWCPHERYLAEAYGSTRADGCCGLDELLEGLSERERLDHAGPGSGPT